VSGDLAHEAGDATEIFLCNIVRLQQCLRREMTNAEKGAILVLYLLLYTITTISFIVGRPYMTVKNFLTRTLERESISNKSRSGRPPKLSKRDRRAISRYIKRNRTASREEVRQPQDYRPLLLKSILRSLVCIVQSCLFYPTFSP